MDIRPLSLPPAKAPAPRTAAPAAEETRGDLDPRIAAIEPPPKLVDPPKPVARLPRPVLVIAGGSRKEVGLPEVIHYLTKGGNNGFAGVYGVDRKAEIAQEHKANGGNVFTLRYMKQFNSFDQNAKEIRQAIADIRKMTGADEIDVVAECKGAMETREYLREGHDGIRNLVMIVPPNHGIPVGGDLAWTVAQAVQKLHLPIKTFSGYPLDADSFKALGSFSTDWSLGPFRGNKAVHAFNTPENVANESRVLHSLTVVAGEGENLLENQLGPGLPFPLMRGDHSIPNWSAFLPHANNFFYDGERAQHGQVKSHPEALAKIAETLVADGAPVKDEHYQSKAPSVARVMTRSTAWTASFAGRVNVAVQSLQGDALGPAGQVLGGLGAGIAALDGTRQLVSAVRDTAPQGRVKASVGALGKYAQTAGCVMGLAGLGWPAAALIAGGLVASTLTA